VEPNTVRNIPCWVTLRSLSTEIPVSLEVLCINTDETQTRTDLGLGSFGSSSFWLVAGSTNQAPTLRPTANGETEDAELEAEVPIHENVDHKFPKGITQTQPEDGEVEMRYLWNGSRISSVPLAIEGNKSNWSGAWDLPESSTPQRTRRSW